MADILHAKNISVQFGGLLAVNNVSFTIPERSIVSLIGPNGAGKTTTIRILLGLISPTSGSAEVLGNSVSEPEKYLANIGAMIEGPAFYPALSGVENLKILATLGGIDFSVIPDLMTKVGLADRADSKYKTYSLGMKQRLGIAAALLPNPKLLILDEPTRGLDYESKTLLTNFLNERSESGAAVLIATHDVELVAELASRIIILAEGEVVADGDGHRTDECQQEGEHHHFQRRILNP